MVVETTAIVPDRGLDGLRESVEAPEDVLRVYRLKLRVTLQRFVEVGRVGTMMLLVMDLHRPGIDMGFQSIVVETELRKLKRIGHENGLLSRMDRPSLEVVVIRFGRCTPEWKKVRIDFPFSVEVPSFPTRRNDA
jgi:hypothetical protein